MIDILPKLAEPDSGHPHYVPPTEAFRDPAQRLHFLASVDAVAREIFAINCAKGFWKDELSPEELTETVINAFTQNEAEADLGSPVGLDALRRELPRLVQRARETAPHNKGEKLMLMVSEISEQLECIRNGTSTTPCEKDSEITQEEEEVADLFIRLADYCGKNRLRLSFAVLRKIEVNRLRKPKHGKAF